MKYEIVRGCAWKDFDTYGREGQTIDAGELKTSDGKPLPAEVVQHFVSSRCLTPVTDSNTQ